MNIPDEDYFMELGYDKVKGEGTVHYRYIVDRELEDSIYVDKSPFHEYMVKRGQSRGKNSTIKDVGKFKGILKLTNKSLDDLKIEKPKYMSDPIWI